MYLILTFCDWLFSVTTIGYDCPASVSPEIHLEAVSGVYSTRNVVMVTGR